VQMTSKFLLILSFNETHPSLPVCGFPLLASR
jgi:hypothetical protein